MYVVKVLQSLIRKPSIVGGLAFLGLMLTLSITAVAQAGGAIEGTVTDTTGAVVANAQVTAVNVSTGIATSRPTTASGFFSITLLIPGKYTVTVAAAGFETFKQENFNVDNEHTSALNPKLKVGAQSETITVTEEPPALETTNANLGGTIRNDVYTELPVILQTGGPSAQQRDVTTFSNLLPGAQQPPGGRISQFGGMPQRLAEVYVDGLPLTIASAQSDNRPVYNVLPLENIDQVQVMSSGFTAETQGAGFESFSTKSGGNKYHGALFGLLRNTLLDAWTFSTKCGPKGGTPIAGCGNVVPVVTNGVITNTAGPKQGEHQDEYGIALGGPVLKGHSKLFVFGSYDRFRSQFGVNPSATTIPTTTMRTGNFQELIKVANGGLGNTSTTTDYPIYDPTTQTACTSNSTNGTCRYQYGYGPGAGTGAAGNPVLVSAANLNIIPTTELSPQMQYLQHYLPTPSLNTVGVIQNNYLGGTPTGNNNWLGAVRGDYDISDKDRLFALFAMGNRLSVPFNGSSILPLPYLTTFNADVRGHFIELQESHTFSTTVANQFRYGYLYFGGPPITNPTMGVSQWEPASAGILGLPAGQASLDFPNVSFGGSNAQATWNNGSQTYRSISETYEVVDNVLWTKGRNAMNIGFELQWLETNTDSADTASQQLGLAFSTNETAQLNPNNAGTYASNSGYSYASFMLGAVSSPTVTQQPFTLFGMRFRPYAPYFQDDFKVNSKLTLNLGLRWDYMPTYREAQNRWSFLNPTATNPITGNPGALNFAGTYGGPNVSCNCKSPVNNWRKNFGPRVGFSYAVNNKTVLRGAYALVYSHGGGTGGSNGNDGTGLNGFTVQSGWVDSTAGAPFYLNSNTNFPTSGGANVTGPNSNFGGAGFVFPTVTGINITAASAGILTGYYVCNGQTFAPCYGRSNVFAAGPASQNYADPYYGGRAPEISFFNLGVQRELTKAMTIMVNYVGTNGHFLPGNNNLRGQYSNQINPTYLSTIGVPNLNLPATAANVATVNTACGNCLPSIPYFTAANGYEAAAALSSTATIGHMLTWMPQYTGVNDTFGVMGANAEYNALQLTLSQRFAKGLNFTVNYTFSHTIDDVGTIRTGFPIPATAIATQHTWKADRIDRSRSTTDLPQLLTVFGVYKLPFGKGGLGANNLIVRKAASGWQLSGISQYASGLPLPIVGSAASPAQNFGQGQVMLDYNPNFHGSPRINGKWGQGALANNLSTRPYIQGYISNANAGNGTSGVVTTANSGTSSVPCASSVGPFCNTATGTVGDTARVAPYGLRAPSIFRLTMSVNRTFDLTDRFKLVFRVDCQNVTNHVTFGNNFANQSIGVNPTSTAFGTVAIASNDSRAFQFQGRLQF